MLSRHAPAVEVRLQPIVALSTRRVVAAEALGRLPDGTPVLQALALAEARGELDLLEAALLRCALAARDRLSPGCLLSLNVLPASLTGPASTALLDSLPSLTGLVLEIHQDRTWDDDPAVLGRIDVLRDRGALVALDDAAEGFQGLLTISRLRPDWVKIDRSVVTGAHADPVRRASLDMFAQCAHRCGCLVVAEGVETAEDLAPLREVGVELAQGYWFSPPVCGDVPTELVPRPRSSDDLQATAVKWS